MKRNVVIVAVAVCFVVAAIFFKMHLRVDDRCLEWTIGGQRSSTVEAEFNGKGPTMKLRIENDDKRVPEKHPSSQARHDCADVVGAER